ncbi:ScyD/ScyE family protein [Actinophytocola sp.]|uniref:ScyD/ScyE family protein n=1 Tax=Actinophytocola sp. TaxID=1872138 RepID=UPI003899A4AA
MASAKRIWAGALLVTAVLGSLTATAVTSQAATSKNTRTPVVVASGLHNPRSVTIGAGGTILIGEGGSGPTTPCTAPAPGVITRCLGFTGSIYAIAGSRQRRVVTGLPSEAIVRLDGTVVIAGATQAVPHAGGTFAVIYGFSGGPADRAALGAGSGPLGTLSLSNGTLLGDLTAYEAAADPDGTGVFANPWNFVEDGNGGFLATDAGANDVLSVAPNGTVSTAAVVPSNVTSTGAQAQSVPTGIVRASNGVFYISDMSGENVGLSRIWRYVPGSGLTLITTGLTDVIALALAPNGDLIALSYGSTPPVGTQVPGPGSLARINVRTGVTTTIDTGGVLNAPTGLAVDSYGNAYVLNNAITNNGELLKFSGAAR